MCWVEGARAESLKQNPQKNANRIQEGISGSGVRLGVICDEPSFGRRIHNVEAE